MVNEAARENGLAFVYVIAATDEWNNRTICKLGVSIDPDERFRSVKANCALPSELYYVVAIMSEGQAKRLWLAIEKSAARAGQLSPKKWIIAPPEALVQTIERTARALKIELMTPREAQDYLIAQANKALSRVVPVRPRRS
jgi:hypothetical protein